MLAVKKFGFADELIDIQGPPGPPWGAAVRRLAAALGLRIRDTQERVRAEEEHQPLRIAALQARILVVEDETIVAMDLIATLRRMGHQVVAHALCGPDAVAQALQHRPDMVLMDIRLQGEMDGIEAARQIRGQLGLPVVYLTAFVDDATRARAQQTQPAGWLRKPFSKYELEDVIQVVLQDEKQH